MRLIRREHSQSHLTTRPSRGREERGFLETNLSEREREGEGERERGREGERDAVSLQQLDDVCIKYIPV